MEEKEENRRKGRRMRNAGGGVDEEKNEDKEERWRKTQWEGENEGSERALLKEEISGGRGGVKQKNRKV